MAPVAPSAAPFWRRAPATSALVLACAAAFAAELARTGFGPSVPPDALRRLGALAPERVWAGEGWRVLTAGLLHDGPLHLSVNLLGLVLLGGEVEPRLGSLRTLLLLAGAQLGCAAAALGFGDLTPRLGASGMAYGLLGALLVSSWRRRRQGAQAFRVVLALAPVAVLLGLLGPDVDALGHLGGLLAGAALAAGLEPGGGPERAVSLGFALLLLGVALGLGLWRPGSALWQTARGYRAFEQDRCAEAVPHFQRALGRDLGAFLPEEVHAALGHCLLKLGERDAGMAELGEAAEGGSVYGALLLGDQEAEDPHRALRAYARALSLRPGDARTREVVLRSVLYLCEFGDLPGSEDLAPVRYQLELEGMEPLRLSLAAAEAAEGQPEALLALRPSDGFAARIAEALQADSGTTAEAAVQLRRAILAEAPEVGRE